MNSLQATVNSFTVQIELLTKQRFRSVESHCSSFNVEQVTYCKIKTNFIKVLSFNEYSTQ